ncbi:MAG: transketolase C-terminal domain-containing protein [Planctomycetota bacterium]
MGADLPAATTVAPEQRHRAGLDRPDPLAGNPPGAPQFSTTVQRADGAEQVLADPTATRLAVALMNMHAVMGGAACHWGGPSAYAEIMAAVHGIMFEAEPWYDHFNFVNDAGHAENGIYALKANYQQAGIGYADLKGFRSISSKLTGHGEAHLFPEGVMLSNGPLGSRLPQAQGLAMADRVAGNDRATLCVISDGAMKEGEAKEAVAAIPGLAGRDLVNPFVLMVSDNDTKLSGRITEQSFDMGPTFTALEATGWRVVKVTDGHDLQAVYSAVELAVADAKADHKRPVAIWFKTIKGKGVQTTEQSSSGGHGYPLKKPGDLRAFCEEIAGGALPELFETWLRELELAGVDAEAASVTAPKKADAPKTGKIQGGFPKAMLRCAQEGLPVVSISADLAGSTGVAPFAAEFPQFSFDVGIAEANMVSTAAGFSRQGYIPVVDTFAQFGVTKGALPLCMANLSQSPVIAVFTHIGFQDAADGASHQSLMYLAMSGAIPHVQCYCPASAEEAEWAMETAIRRFADQRQQGEMPDTVLFFCGRENFPVSLKPQDAAYSWGSAMCVADTTEGKDRSVVISANASCVAYALEAVEQLGEQGIGVLLLNNATPNRPDVAGHQAALERCDGRLITVEDHQAIGGAGSMLATALAREGIDFRIRLLGVPGHFGQSAYQASELYDKYGIGPAAMRDAAIDLCR